MFSRINITPSTLPILTLLSNVRNVRQQGLDISPDYQRGYIWSNEYKDQLIISIILNYPIGNIVINNLRTPNIKNAKQELVDGKQRITTILRFVDNGVAPEETLDSDDNWSKLSTKPSEQAKQIIADIINNPDDPELKKMMKVKRLSFRDFPNSIQNFFYGYSLPVYTMEAADPAQIRDYFKVLQNQEKLRAGEIINSLPDNPLLPYFQRIPSVFLEKINSQNLKRAEFEKTFYSIVGLWSDAIQINSEDKKIIDFIEKLDNVSSWQAGQLECMLDNLVHICEMGANATRYRISKRTLKLILGLAIYARGFFEERTLSKVDYICKISSKLAAFNSSESNENSFTKYFGDEYTINKDAFVNNMAPRYRLLFAATARSTSKADFIAALKTLVELINENIEE